MLTNIYKKEEIMDNFNTEDEKAIKEIWNNYILGCNTGDVDLWSNLWTDDGIRMSPDMPPVFGKEQIREGIKSSFNDFNFDFDIKVREIKVSGELAYSSGTFTNLMTSKTDGQKTKIEGKYLSILERQKNGEWKIARDCYNYNQTPIVE
jgi:uncharacterized protein (TIGR02246 family)